MLRWEECVKRDMKKAGEEDDWKKKTRNRGGWKRLSDEAVKKLRQHLTTDKGKRGREGEIPVLKVTCGDHGSNCYFPPSLNACLSIVVAMPSFTALISLV